MDDAPSSPQHSRLHLDPAAAHRAEEPDLDLDGRAVLTSSSKDVVAWPIPVSTSVKITPPCATPFGLRCLGPKVALVVARPGSTRVVVMPRNWASGNEDSWSAVGGPSWITVRDRTERPGGQLTGQASRA